MEISKVQVGKIYTYYPACAGNAYYLVEVVSVKKRASVRLAGCVGRVRIVSCRRLVDELDLFRDNKKENIDE